MELKPQTILYLIDHQSLVTVKSSRAWDKADVLLVEDYIFENKFEIVYREERMVQIHNRDQLALCRNLVYYNWIRSKLIQYASDTPKCAMKLRDLKLPLGVCASAMGRIIKNLNKKSGTTLLNKLGFEPSISIIKSKHGRANQYWSNGLMA